MNLEALACLKSPISTDFSISFYTSASFNGSYKLTLNSACLN